jgi:hypothetical protein
VLYDSKGREKLESKVDLSSRGVESPDRAMRSSEQSCSAAHIRAGLPEEWVCSGVSWILDFQQILAKIRKAKG